MNSLYSFVKDSLEKGISRNAIRDALIQAGWQEDEIKNALSAFAEVIFPLPVPKPKPYLQAREAFLYLVSFIALYTSAISFGSLVFQFINKAFPDPISMGQDLSLGNVRMSLASLVVAFPLYIFLTWQLAKAVLQNSERRQSKVRKWLTYGTLVVASGVIIGDLIALVSNILGGELTFRFILKVIAVFAVSGSIFGYYLFDLRKEEK